MRTSTKILAAVTVAGAAFALRWRQNHKRLMAEREIRSEIPEDVAEGFEIPLDENKEFEDIAKLTCMSRCCYTPMDGVEIQAYGFAGGDSDTPFRFDSDC